VVNTNRIQMPCGIHIRTNARRSNARIFWNASV
jgi:hypothetical protein